MPPAFPLRLVQLQQGIARRIACVEEPYLRLLDRHSSIYALASASLAAGRSLSTMVGQLATGERLDYDAIYRGESPWRLLAPIDHPEDSARCLVSGTGLTHLGSAKDRSAMHTPAPEQQLTDSMRMFEWGIAGGRPTPGQAGIAPEWFYKGTGAILRNPDEALEVPAYGEDGGEEAEVAGIYLNDFEGRPHRLGLAIGNEFSDHVFEKKNYLNLAGSKIRTCAIGPELVVAPEFSSVPGRVEVQRAGRTVWTKAIATGEAEMSHSLANIEHHHFKFEAHRRPDDLHVHFFGAHSLSFGAGVGLADGDVMMISFDGFGRPLRNPLRVVPPSDRAITVSVMN